MVKWKKIYRGCVISTTFYIFPLDFGFWHNNLPMWFVDKILLSYNVVIFSSRNLSSHFSTVTSINPWDHTTQKVLWIAIDNQFIYLQTIDFPSQITKPLYSVWNCEFHPRILCLILNDSQKSPNLWTSLE